MLAGEKIRLYPTAEQVETFRMFSGAARFTYNTCLAEKIRAYQEDGISLSTFDLIQYADSLKYKAEYPWLKQIPSGVVRTASRDLSTAYTLFYKRGNTGFPKFKEKGKCKEGFGINIAEAKYMFVDSTHIKLSKIKDPIRIKEHWIPDKVLNPRVSFDGKYWYFSFSYEVKESAPVKEGRVVGVDLGIKSLAVTSDGVVYKNINKTARVRQLEKRKRHLQRQIARKYGRGREKTNNILKLERKVRLIERKLKNIRNTYVHTVTASIVKTKPYAVVIEDLNVWGMLKNKHLSRAIQQQELFKFRQYITYKCQAYGSRIIVADRYYPSSKKCSNCGAVKMRLSLSERTYRCDCCGVEMDRDLNASLNLKHYGEEIAS